MTHVIIKTGPNTYIHKTYPKTPTELYREILLGSFDSPVAMKNPTAVKLQDTMLIAEREESPLLKQTEHIIMELLVQGATETELEHSLHLSRSGIRHHLDKLKKKFQVTTRQELVSAYWRQNRG